MLSNFPEYLKGVKHWDYCKSFSEEADSSQKLNLRTFVEHTIKLIKNFPNTFDTILGTLFMLPVALRLLDAGPKDSFVSDCADALEAIDGAR